MHDGFGADMMAVIAWLEGANNIQVMDKISDQ
jgi:hypothetical protein